MTTKGWFCTCATGTVVAAICCFTPALVILLGALGLSAWLGWLDYVLLPALALFAAFTVWFGVRLRRERRRSAPGPREETPA